MNKLSRPDPEACREQDQGKFEVIRRDGWARIGKFHTQHGIIDTPTLLPVINPNIKTITPRDMWENYGVQGLITNSYIIWKHEKLRQPALEHGVHELIDFPGFIMTDSGTFQAYVYGDVEVGAEEIVEFQRNIGVDVATMLDVFTRPDMSVREWDEAVIETEKRAGPAINAAGSTMLNGPIQGGLDYSLRKKSSQIMSKHAFAVHPIGGIVPIMEQQRYREFFELILTCNSELPSDRPVHFFGCGHPMLFPLSIALGADLFDSAAYVLFARDGRLLSPEGTVHLEKLEEWPIHTIALYGITPDEVRKMDKNDRTEILARANLEITFAELAKCRQAIRDGTIWRLAEQRSHCNPELREAWIELQKQFHSGKWDNMCRVQNPHRKSGVRCIGESSVNRPDIRSAHLNLQTYWREYPPSREGNGLPPLAVIFTGVPQPHRAYLSRTINHLMAIYPNAIPLISTAAGLVPYSLEDISPFAHLETIADLDRSGDSDYIMAGLVDLGLNEMNFEILGWQEKYAQMEEILTAMAIKLKIGEEEYSLYQNQEVKDKVRTITDRISILDKLTVFTHSDYKLVWEEIQNATFLYSRTGRIKNIHLKDGTHVASPRLTDGGISLTEKGAEWLHSMHTSTLPSNESFNLKNTYIGIPRVVIEDDAIPFIRKGRNVFHGFIISVDSWIRPGFACVIIDSKGEIIGHGISRCEAKDMLALSKGIAVRTRGGIKQ